MKHALKVGVSGVRGIVGDSFTPQVAATFAQAFGTFVRQGSVVVGRDTRPSGALIEKAVVAGLQSVGCKPVLLGVVSTPTILVATRARKASGGIAITASHNPSPWNALKFVSREGLFLNADMAEELTDIYHQADFPLAAEEEIPSVTYEDEAVRLHFQRILDYIRAESIRQRNFRVAVDCCNGVGALHSTPFLQDYLGCRVVAIHDRPTGDFEREPEPTPANIEKLCRTVVEEGCDVGFAQDPDGDRVAIVDEQGQPIGEDLTLALGVRQVLLRHEKGPVVANLSTSKVVEHVAHSLGSEVVRSRIGEINVTETMLKLGAVVGGENSGGLIVPKIHPCRDSFAAMALILELLADEGKTVSALRADIPHPVIIWEKIPIRAHQAPAVLRALRWHYKDCKLNLLDGVYVDFGDSWVHVRRSNTEPVIRLASEAPTREKAESLAAEIRSLTEKAMKG